MDETTVHNEPRFVSGNFSNISTLKVLNCVIFTQKNRMYAFFDFFFNEHEVLGKDLSRKETSSPTSGKYHLYHLGGLEFKNLLILSVRLVSYRYTRKAFGEHVGVAPGDSIAESGSSLKSESQNG